MKALSARERKFADYALQRVLHRKALAAPEQFMPQRPTSKQKEFLDLTCLEALYGGAAGGGKSSALLMAALKYVHVPRYSALILRRTYADLSLPGAIMDRAYEWLSPTSAQWNERDKRWTFPSGASLQFGYCETAKDVYRYQGAEFQYIGVDELTQWPERPYRYLLSRIRRLKGSEVPLRMRAASNPGGIGHWWVFDRFLKERKDGKVFVPALLDDNPYLDAEEYRKSLQELDEHTRKQLELGLWIQDASGLVYKFDLQRNLISEFNPVSSYGEWTWVLSLDFGVKDATAWVVLGWRSNDPHVYVAESGKRTGMLPGDVAEVAYELSRRYSFSRVVGDIGGLGKAYAEEMRRRYHIPVEPADKVNKLGYISLMNGALERGNLLLCEETNQELAKELQELPWSDETHQKESEGFDNHMTDALLYGWRVTYAYTERTPEPPKAFDVAVKEQEDALMRAAEEEALRQQQEEEMW